jgi:hypothetical protein
MTALELQRDLGGAPKDNVHFDELYNNNLLGANLTKTIIKAHKSRPLTSLRIGKVQGRAPSLAYAQAQL